MREYKGEDFSFTPLSKSLVTDHLKEIKVEDIYPTIDDASFFVCSKTSRWYDETRFVWTGGATGSDRVCKARVKVLDSFS